jgi:hypothetical protein
VHVLPELVHEGHPVQHGVPRGLPLEADGADLQRGGADRLLHLEADRLDSGERHERTPQPEEVAHPRAVADGRHVVPGRRGLGQQRHRDGGAEPDPGVRVEEDPAEALSPGGAAPEVDLEVDPLRRRGAHLEDERLVSRPVAREALRDVGQRDPRLARRKRRVEADRRRQGRLLGRLGVGPARHGPGGQRGQENGCQDPARHGRLPSRSFAMFASST